MKLRLAALIVCAMLSAGSFAATSGEKSAMAFTQAICDAFKEGDLVTLEGALAPEFTLVGSDSSVQDRGQTLAEVRAHEPRYETFRNHGMSAHVYRDAAVVQGITSLKGTFHGKPFAAEVRFTDTLIRAQGRWRLVVSHVTRIPQK